MSLLLPYAILRSKLSLYENLRIYCYQLELLLWEITLRAFCFEMLRRKIKFKFGSLNSNHLPESEVTILKRAVLAALEYTSPLYFFNFSFYC